ncbi:MAG TPA: hypothetical protein DEH75_13820 [Bradyrhizobium sp.]|nr:hypothetical protein [Bradyrhizobium sp.]HBY27593.1 hypothetical protein [Bradyrhizobium sp.]
MQMVLPPGGGGGGSRLTGGIGGGEIGSASPSKAQVSVSPNMMTCGLPSLCSQVLFGDDADCW